MNNFLDKTGLAYFWGKIKATLDSKVDVVDGKGLSTNDLTDVLKSNYNVAYTHSQTAHAPSNAEQNVQSDWSVTDVNSDAYIKNKPDVATQADLSAIEAVLTSV